MEYFCSRSLSVQQFGSEYRSERGSNFVQNFIQGCLLILSWNEVLDDGAVYMFSSNDALNMKFVFINCTTDPGSVSCLRSTSVIFKLYHFILSCFSL